MTYQFWNQDGWSGNFLEEIEKNLKYLAKLCLSTKILCYTGNDGIGENKVDWK